jgi:hypothetical protein|tara:strand:+ start:471 stop:782 length:312 start_codon:yes stop_codon:yes gene_type:complete
MRKKRAVVKRIRCNISKTRFENLYKIVLTKKRELIKKGRNHPYTNFDKVSIKINKSRLSIEIKIGLVAKIIIKQRIVIITDARRDLPSLKILITKPNDAHKGI